MATAGFTAALATLLLGAAFTLPAAAAGWSWNGNARAEGGHTSTVFPGYARSTPDQFTTMSVELSGRARLGGGTRIDGSASAAIDRYQRWPGRDAERYQTEIRARRGIVRLTLKGELNPDVLLFPDVGSDARYRGREGFVGIETAVAGPVMAGLGLRSESRRYDPLHSERDGRRTRWGYSLEWAPKAGPHFGVLFENERSNARDSNYDYYDNRLTMSAELSVASTRLRVEAAPAVRNYFTGSLFASNFYRHDLEQAWRLRLQREIGAGLDLSVLDELRSRDSTRNDRDYHQNTVRFALEWKANH